MSLPGALAGKRVLIIGGVGSGIGRAVTEGVASAGATGIVVVGRNKERAEEAANSVASDTCRAFAILGDARIAEDADRVVADTKMALGGIDVLITVVGGYGLFAPWGPLDETTDETWDLVFDVNLKYVFQYVRACVKVFLEQENVGTIVSVGAITAFTSSPMAVSYGAAKAGLMNMAKTVSAEYGRRGIRMNVVNSGPILTDAGRKGISEGMKMDIVPMGRAGVPEEMANVVVFFASPLSSFVAGQAVAVDGGVTSRAPLRLPNSDATMGG